MDEFCRQVDSGNGDDQWEKYRESAENSKSVQRKGAGLRLGSSVKQSFGSDGPSLSQRPGKFFKRNLLKEAVDGVVTKQVEFGSRFETMKFINFAGGQLDGLPSGGIVWMETQKPEAVLKPQRH